MRHVTVLDLRAAAADIAAAHLRTLLHYDPVSGLFHWTKGRAGVARGSLAGYRAGNGYWYISVHGRKLLAHRLAFLYVTGRWPVGETDHINLCRTDNRWINLRDVSTRVNGENRYQAQSNNHSSGCRGVSWHVHSRKWCTRITTRGITHLIGLFDSVEAASVAYVEAKRRLHEGCTI